MSMANSSLKYNRSLIGKRKFKDVKGLLINQSGKTELEFRQVSSLELAKIKRQIRLNAKKRARRTTYLVLAIIFVSLIGLTYLLNFFS